MKHTHRSCAEWEPGVYCMGTVTTDNHYSYAEAVGVLRLLRLNGFGGERVHFPLRVWVEPIEQ